MRQATFEAKARSAGERFLQSMIDIMPVRCVDSRYDIANILWRTRSGGIEDPARLR